MSASLSTSATNNKRTLTAYNVFVKSETARMKHAGESMRTESFLKKIGAKWHSLSEEQKEPYVRQAAKENGEGDDEDDDDDGVVFLGECVANSSSVQSEEEKNAVTFTVTGVPSSSKKKRKWSPPSPFKLFSNSYRKQNVSKLRNCSNKEVTALVKKSWKALPSEAKAVFIEQSDNEQERRDELSDEEYLAEWYATPTGKRALREEKKAAQEAMIVENTELKEENAELKRNIAELKAEIAEFVSIIYEDE